MILSELKTLIEQNRYFFSASSPILIFKYSDSKFVADQYLRQIATNLSLNISKSYNIEDLPSADTFSFGIPDNLYILDVEKLDSFEEISELVDALVPTAVICKTIEKNCPFDIIEIPKLLEWQVEDYVKGLIPGLSEDDCKWLCKIANYDIYRLYQESQKLNIFPKKTQEMIFREIDADNGYSDLNYLTIFNLTEAVAKKDKSMIAAVLKDRDQLDLEPAGFVTILLKKYRKLIDVKTSAEWSEKLGMSQKQYAYLKFNDCKLYSTNNLIDIYDMLLSVDLLLKSGQLEYNRIIDYIIDHIFSY